MCHRHYEADTPRTQAMHTPAPPGTDDPARRRARHPDVADNKAVTG
jgi:hypothetical protein